MYFELNTKSDLILSTLLAKYYAKTEQQQLKNTYNMQIKSETVYRQEIRFKTVIISTFQNTAVHATHMHAPSTLSAVVYGCQLRFLTFREEHRLQPSESKAFRKIS